VDELPEAPEAEVLLTAFDRTDICPVDIGGEAKRLL
jgi:hypothetical protein